MQEIRGALRSETGTWRRRKRSSSPPLPDRIARLGDSTQPASHRPFPRPTSFLAGETSRGRGITKGPWQRVLPETAVQPRPQAPFAACNGACQWQVLARDESDCPSLRHASAGRRTRAEAAGPGDSQRGPGRPLNWFQARDAYGLRSIPWLPRHCVSADSSTRPGMDVCTPRGLGSRFRRGGNGCRQGQSFAALAHSRSTKLGPPTQPALAHGAARPGKSTHSETALLGAEIHGLTQASQACRVGQPSLGGGRGGRDGHRMDGGAVGRRRPGRPKPLPVDCDGDCDGGPAHPPRALVSPWMEAPKPTAAAPRLLAFPGERILGRGRCGMASGWPRAGAPPPPSQRGRQSRASLALALSEKNAASHGTETYRASAAAHDGNGERARPPGRDCVGRPAIGSLPSGQQRHGAPGGTASSRGERCTSKSGGRDGPPMEARASTHAAMMRQPWPSRVVIAVRVQTAGDGIASERRAGWGFQKTIVQGLRARSRHGRMSRMTHAATRADDDDISGWPSVCPTAHERTSAHPPYMGIMHKMYLHNGGGGCCTLTGLTHPQSIPPPTASSSIHPSIP